jgi:hypothetical protein
MRVPTSAHTLGLVAAALAALQPWLLLLLGEPDVSSLAALAADPLKSKRIFVVMLLFIPAMFVAYWIAAADCLSVNPIYGTFTLFAFALWFALELGPRSFDLWIVQNRWLPRYLSASPPQREALEQSYSFYRDGVFALAFVRRHALLVGQLCLALSTWRVRPWGMLLAMALSLSVVRLLLGSLATYGDWHRLDVIADPLYFVTAGLTFPLLAAWLWSRRRTTD